MFIPEIRDLIQFARERGIRIIPEFDSPGHTTHGLPAVVMDSYLNVTIVMENSLDNMDPLIRQGYELLTLDPIRPDNLSLRFIRPL